MALTLPALTADCMVSSSSAQRPGALLDHSGPCDRAWALTEPWPICRWTPSSLLQSEHRDSIGCGVRWPGSDSRRNVVRDSGNVGI